MSIRLIKAGLVFFAASALGHETSQHRPTHYGLMGYGIPMYEPLCAFACREILRWSPLSCSVPTEKRLSHETSPECVASNDPYLLSLAGCMQEQCGNRTELWDLEKFWALDAVPSPGSPPTPAYSYAEAQIVLNTTENSASRPSATFRGTLESVSRVSQEDWQLAYATLYNTAWVEKQHSKHGIILIVSVIAIPACVHMLRLVRLPTAWERQTVALLGHSALFRGRHSVPLPYNIGILPTRGQSAFIAAIITLNLVLMFTGYRFTVPNLWQQSATERLIPRVANRAGVLAFANLSLMMLCCGRNNLAVRFTKWSYSTMLLYHRWIAYICILQALTHSSIYFITHIPFLARKFTQAYWILGVISFGLMCLVLPLSILAVRRRAYEFFVDTHIVLSFFILLGLGYHIYEKFLHQNGHENWIYLAGFLWLADRFFRAVKLAGKGIQTAYITHIDEDYARIDIPGVKGAGHAYVYFPTLSWRIWQNHPFSIAASVHEDLTTYLNVQDQTMLHEEESLSTDQRPLLAYNGTAGNGALSKASSSDSLASLVHGNSAASESEKADTPQSDESDGAREAAPVRTGLTFFIRRQRGITARLFKAPEGPIKTLVEGPYRPLPIPNIATCPTLVCIAGGVGIATVLPSLSSHCVVGRSILYWSSRSESLVESVGMDALRRAGVKIHVKIRERWDLEQIVSSEAAIGVPRGDVIVLVSGPDAMADNVRAAVVKANILPHKGRGRVRLVEECFSW